MKFQPLRNLVLNVGLRKLRSGIANDRKSPAIFREGAVRRIQAAQQCAENGLLWLLAIGAVKNKVLLAKAFEKPRILQNFQVTRCARLTVARDPYKIRYGQFSLTAQ